LAPNWPFDSSGASRPSPHGRGAPASPSMPGVKGQPFCGKRKNRHRQQSSSKFRSGQRSAEPFFQARQGRQRTRALPDPAARRAARWESKYWVLKGENTSLKRVVAFERSAHKATVVDCCKHHVDLGTPSAKPFAEQGPAEKAGTMGVAMHAWRMSARSWA
jgi:hypothetical protein